MDQLQKLNICLNNIGHFSEEDIALLYHFGYIYTYKKNDYILNENQVCDCLFFILSGACYQYLKEDIEEKIQELYIAFDCALDSVSFINQEPSKVKIKAFNDCEILVLNIDSIHRLIQKSNVFLQLGKLMNPHDRLLFFDNSMNPSQKYNHILTNKPTLLKIFPLKYIASYLKITPETLSRVRAK